MIKNHLKRIATPRTWGILRKESVFVTRPNAGAHSYTHATSLNTLFKEMLGLAATTKEVKRILHEKEVLVDGKRRHDERHNVGYLDVVTLKQTGESYRLGFSTKGKLAAFGVPKGEADVKVARIEGKHHIKGGKQQLLLSDGRTLIIAKDGHKVGDSLLIALPSQEVKAHLPLAPGATAIIHKGKYTGTEGVVESLEGASAVMNTKDGQVHTKRSYVFVVGDKKPAIKCSP